MTPQYRLRSMRSVLVSAALLALTACSGGSTAPTPTPPPTTPTRIITVTGDLAFGNVNLGSTADRTFTIGNSGNATLTFTGMNGIGGTGTAGYTIAPLTGSVAPGSTIVVTVHFAPTIAQFYSNVLTIASDRTSGGNQINVSGFGINNTPIFTQSGVGDSVFDMPLTVTRVRVQAVPTTSCQNFIVRISGRASLINVILGTCSVADARTLDSTYLTGGGGVVSITNSTGVQWTFTELR